MVPSATQWPVSPASPHSSIGGKDTGEATLNAQEILKLHAADLHLGSKTDTPAFQCTQWGQEIRGRGQKPPLEMFILSYTMTACEDGCLPKT